MNIGNSMISPPATDNYRSPVGRPPRWLLWLFPALGDLSQNPLYIRLSGQGYGRRGFWRRLAGPPEFRATSFDWFHPQYMGSSSLIILIILAPISLYMFALSAAFTGRPNSIMGAWFIFMAGLYLSVFLIRAFLGTPRRAAQNLFRQARLHGWGDDLFLTRLTPKMVRTAIFAMLLPQVARRLAFVIGAGGLILSFVGYHPLPLMSFSVSVWGILLGLEAFDITCSLQRNSINPLIEKPPSNSFITVVADTLSLMGLLLGPFLLMILLSVLFNDTLVGLCFVTLVATVVTLALIRACVNHDLSLNRA